MSEASRPLTQVVGAAILDDAEHPTSFLAGQRAYPPALRGLWEFPGGKVEPGESPQDGLVRECGEELGLTVRLLQEVPGPLAQGWPLHGTAAMRVWTAVVVGPARDAAEADSTAQADSPQTPMPQSTAPQAPAPQTPAPGDDHLALQWLPLERAADREPVEWIPADLPIVEALRAVLGSGPGA